jgi:hypothetical protein
MLQRCHNPSHRQYKNYGGRGIFVWASWRVNPETFIAWVNKNLGPRPTKAHSIDRINNAKGYEPGNLRWATAKEQTRNTRVNHRIEFGGRTLTIGEWAEELNLPYHTVYNRLKCSNWSIESVLTKWERK